MPSIHGGNTSYAESWPDCFPVDGRRVPGRLAILALLLPDNNEESRFSRGASWGSDVAAVAVPSAVSWVSSPLLCLTADSESSVSTTWDSVSDCDF